MNKHSISSLFPLLAIALSTTVARADYSSTVLSLNPAGYWPLNETNQPPTAYIAINSGSLGSQGNGYYNNAYYPDGTSFDLKTLFTGPVTGATSDGNAAAQFNGGANGNDNSGYVLIPDLNHCLDTGIIPFSAEAWVMPEGGDPNDPSGASYASTEWTSIIKKGGGGMFYTENGDVNGNSYGWTVALAGKYVLGAPAGWYGGTPYTSPLQLQTNACWVVDFYNGANGNTPSLEFDVPLNEPTPQWFHLTLTYDGTNANFFVNGTLTATTVLGLPQSTNDVFAPNNYPASPTGAYQFINNANGSGYVPDTVNPACVGNINESYSIIQQGYPAPNAIGFNCQNFNGAMDEVAVYTNALSAATVAQHFADATAANKTLYTNDVFSANPLVYLRFDEPAYVEPPSDYSTYPVATNYGYQAGVNGLYQPGVTLTVSGPPVTGFGSNSYAVQMNGLDAAVDIGDGVLFGTDLDPQGNVPMTLAYWFKANPADSYGRFQGIVGRGDSGWRSSMDNSGEVRWNPGNGPELATPQNYNDGLWHYFVGVSDGANDFLYIDGQLKTYSSGVGTLGGASPDILIGGAPDYTTSSENYSQQRYFAGAISQVAFFTNALTASQIQTLYNSAGFKPTISVAPKPIIIGLGSSGSLSVTALGSTPFGYRWYQGSTALSDVAGNLSGSLSNVLTITNATLANAGNYTVVITNTSGAVTSSIAVVTISSAPTIVTQPAPATTTMYAGNQIGFNIGVLGSSPFSYQWYKASSAISGATSSNVVITALLGSNIYYCIVTNTYGSITSSVVSVIGQTFIAPTSGFTVNFAVAPGSTASQVYKGQGVYSDPGNNIWNPFSGTSGAATALAFTSASNQTLVTATLNFGFNNGAANNTTNGTPSWLLSYEDGVNTNYPGGMVVPTGTLEINDLPQGSYKLYLYGANYDNTRGSIFATASANGGDADEGINGTLNGSVIGQNAIANGVCTFAEGDNYVLFTNVMTDAYGAITVTYIPNPNAPLTGEAPFNGIQVIGNFVAKTTLTILKSGTSEIITWVPSGGVLQSATNVAGPYADITGSTSPYTITISGTQQFFRVKVQ
jgi:hypothetical protein